jgi:predicted metal-dependent hydrolase
VIAKEYNDEEFGTIAIKRIAKAKYVRVRVGEGGVLHATMPRLAPVLLLRNLINSSRESLRKAIADTKVRAKRVYAEGDIVGTSHKIVIEEAERRRARRKEQMIVWNMPDKSEYEDPVNQDVIRKAVRKALDEQASAYLPRRLQYLADIGGFHFSKIRYSNSKGRWGSCSSQGVISLNVALMNLPKELIDYVLIHELSHTKQMNHSPEFWQIVEAYCPEYKAARKELKAYSPYL